MTLPPIVRPRVDDPYAKSKLLTYTRSRERQKMLNKLMLVSVKFVRLSFSCILYDCFGTLKCYFFITFVKFQPCLLSAYNLLRHTNV